MIDESLKKLQRLIKKENYQSKTGLIAKPHVRKYPIIPMDEIEIIEYPPGSREHPKSNGKYFVHMCNRGTTISYFGEDINDFSEFNINLHISIPMGHASLWVMQRTYLIHKENNEYKWEFNEADKDTWHGEEVFYLFNPNGELRYPDIIARIFDNKKTKDMLCKPQ